MKHFISVFVFILFLFSFCVTAFSDSSYHVVTVYNDDSVFSQYKYINEYTNVLPVSAKTIMDNYPDYVFCGYFSDADYTIPYYSGFTEHNEDGSPKDINIYLKLAVKKSVFDQYDIDSFLSDCSVTEKALIKACKANVYVNDSSSGTLISMRNMFSTIKSKISSQAGSVTKIVVIPRIDADTKITFYIYNDSKGVFEVAHNYRYYYDNDIMWPSVKCSLCGDIKTLSVSSHVIKTVPAENCKTYGKEYVYNNGRNGDLSFEYIKINSFKGSHNINTSIEDTNAPKYGETGYCDFSGITQIKTETCSVCGAKTVTEISKSKSNHIDLNQDGYCDACLAFLECKHLQYTSSVMKPTCTEQGYTKHMCTNCNSYYCDIYTEPLKHSVSSYQFQNQCVLLQCDTCSEKILTSPTLLRTDFASCVTEGTEYYQINEHEWVINTEITRRIPMLSHSFSIQNQKEPSCTENGNITYICAQCKTTKTEIIPKLNHSINSYSFNWETNKANFVCERGCEYCLSFDVTMYSEPPSCSEDGITTYVAACELDSKIYSETKTAILPSSGHDWKLISTQKASCVNEGQNYFQCSKCNQVKTEKIAAGGHFCQERYENNKNPTCIEIGSYDVVTYCQKCNIVLKRQTYTVIPTGHSYLYHSGRAASCTEDGFEDYRTCSKCSYSDYKVIDAIGHQNSQIIIENNTSPSCSQAGECDEVICCTVCKKELSRTHKMLQANAHIEGSMTKENIVPSTCCEKGHHDNVVRCAVCNVELYRQTVTDKLLSHSRGEVLISHTAPTCEDVGYENKLWQCTKCGKELSRTKTVINELGHDESIVENINIINPTCISAGSYEKHVICSLCKKEVKMDLITVSALNHDLIFHSAIAPSCSANGNSSYYTCSRCSYSTYSIIPKAHSFETRQINLHISTCISEGYFDEITICSKCNFISDSERFVIPVSQHTIVHYEAKLPSCEEDGYEAYNGCSVCGAGDKTVIPATGHSEEIINGYDATLFQTGLSNGCKCASCEKILKEQTVIKKLTIIEWLLRFFNSIFIF